MRYVFLLLGGLGVGVSALAGARSGVGVLSSAPLRFEPEGGGAFIARGPEFRARVTASQARLERSGRSVRLSFKNAATPELAPVDVARSTTNLMLGNDRAAWRMNIPNHSRLHARDLYPGIDITWYGNGPDLEYDLTVAPGADVRRIRFSLDGGNSRLRRSGEIAGDFNHKRPVSYQLAADGSHIPVASRFTRNSDGTYGFSVGRYDRSKPLVIDPAFTLGAYVGGTAGDYPVSIGHDAQGYLYVAGTTYSTDVAVTDNSFKTATAGAPDVFIVKIDPKAAPESQVVYATYLGGSGSETLSRMVVRPNGGVFLVGTTTSTDLPLGNAAQATLKGTTDAFIFWLEPSLGGKDALFYGSYLGGAGTETGADIDVSDGPKMYVTGSTSSTDFPRAGAYQESLLGTGDAFAVMIDTSRSEASTLAYSTYLGGTAAEHAHAITAAPDGTMWIAGTTVSYDFPTAGIPFRDFNWAGGDAFIAHINPNVAGGSSLLYASYFGGSGLDWPQRIAVDANGRVIIAGYTLSADFPVTGDALQQQSGGSADAFVTILNPDSPGSPGTQLAYSTYFGGKDGEVVMDMTRDAAGAIYLSGFTLSEDLPVTPNALQSLRPSFSQQGFVVKFDPRRSGSSALDYCSYVGSAGTQVAAAVDIHPSGTVYVSGYTSGAIFDPFGGPAKTTERGTRDGYVFGFTINTPAQ